MTGNLSNMLEPLVLPTGIIGLLLVGTTVYGWRRSGTWVLRWALVLVCAIYFLFAAAPVATLLAWSLEYPFIALEEPTAPTAIIILAGAASVPTSPKERAELNRAAFRRLWRGAELYRNVGGRIPVVYTGQPREVPPGVRNEADLAREVVLRGGILPEHFWLEGESRNTFESAVNVKTLLAGRGVSGPVALVTSAWHMRRAVAAFSKQGLAVLPVPCDRIGGGRWSLSAFLPTYEALSASSITIREWVALGGYWIRGQG